MDNRSVLRPFFSGSDKTGVTAAIAIRRFGQRCARVRRLGQRLAILRTVDEFRSRDAPKGGRVTADAICIASRFCLIKTLLTFPCRVSSFYLLIKFMRFQEGSRNTGTVS